MTTVVHMTSVHPPFDTRIFLKECRSLAKAGYDVTLIVPHDKDEQRDGVKIRHVKKTGGNRLKRMIFTTFAVLRKAWVEKADIYHFHDPELIPAGALLRLSGAKVIYDVHEDLPRQIYQKSWLPGFVKLPLSNCARLTEAFFSYFFYSGVVAAVPSITSRFPAAHSVTVYNYPVLEEGCDRFGATNYEDKPENICYVTSNLCAERGIIEVAEAMSLVKHKDSMLELTGRFTQERVEQQVRSSPIWQRTRFHGWADRNEIEDILARARVGLNILYDTPNHAIALPTKLLEYMAAGIPVISSGLPLERRIIETHACGIIVDPKDPRAIADAIDFILDNPDVAKAMGERGRRAYQNHYNWNSEEKVLFKAYENCIG